MNEMDELARFRAEVPLGVTLRAERIFQDGLSAEQNVVSRPRAGFFGRRLAGPRGVRPVWRYATAVAAAAGLAAGLIVATQSSGPTALTVRLLADRASAAALTQPDVDGSQWVYRVWEVKVNLPVRGGANAVHTQDGWETADGTATYGNNLYEPLGPGNGLPSYAQLGSLPASPAALDAYFVNQDPVKSDNKSVVAFSSIKRILFSFVLPPTLEAEMYQALADIANVQLNTHVTDIAGQPGVAFALPATPQSDAQEIILNASSYSLLAEASWAASISTPGSAAPQIEWAILQQVLVAGPGSTQPDSAPPTAAVTLAAQADAAGTWSKFPLAPPVASQWVYRKLVTSSGTQQVWATADDSQQAQDVNGSLDVCARSAACAASTQWLMPAGPSYSLVNPQSFGLTPAEIKALKALPAGQRRAELRKLRKQLGPVQQQPTLPSTLGPLLTALNGYSTGCTDVSGDCNAVNVIANMLLGYDVPFGTPTTWYLLLGEIPGVTTQNLTDVTGQADVAFEFPYTDGVTAILLNASTYQFAGYVKNGAQTILASQAAVSGPGVQP
jgi:hypothetical protein